MEYKELIEIVKLLQDKWKDFEKDDYFKNERSKYLFCLTEVDGEKRKKVTLLIFGFLLLNSQFLMVLDLSINKLKNPNKFV
ncbi:hypothetical protein [Fusobacterium polymorphum]|jgi:hypothetical protein|uniref:hypothetical protein n=1 Tax=Fusobacterium nucleatum subsp. polymorphum TaxID=76857 RepID=UPI00300AF5A0